MPRLTRNAKYRRHRASGRAIVTLNRRDIYLGPPLDVDPLILAYRRHVQ